MTDLLKLAERVEALEGPDREVDREIALASGDYKTGRGREGMLAHKDTPNQFSYSVPAYTASLDAAMMLVPEGWSGPLHIGGKYSHAELTTCECGEWIDIEVVNCATPALALTAAALRARHD